MNNFIKKYLNQKVRNTISIFIIIFGVLFMYNYTFNSPTYINKYITKNIYKEPANNAFVDQNFYNCVIDSYNNGKSQNDKLLYTDIITDEQLASITYVGNTLCNISNASGIEKLTGLRSLYITPNLDTLDLSNNKELTKVTIKYGQLTTLDLSENVKITDVDVSNNKLTTINVSKNTQLVNLNVENNQLTTIDLSKNLKLKILKLKKNKLTNLDLSNNPELTTLDIFGNKLTALDIGNNLELTDALIYYNDLTDIDVSKNTKLINLDVSGNQLTSIDVSKNLELSSLNVSNNQLTSVDISKNIKLTDLNVKRNKIPTIDLSNNPELTILKIGSPELTALDLSHSLKLNELDISSTNFTTLDISKNLELTSLDANENKLTTMDVSNNQKLERLSVFRNRLTTLDVSKNIKLKELVFNDNKLESIDLSHNQEIKKLYANENKLNSIDLTHNLKIDTGYVGKNNYVCNEGLYIYDRINVVDCINSIVKLPDGKTNTIKSFPDNINENLIVENNLISSSVAGEYIIDDIRFIEPFVSISNYAVSVNLNIIEATSDKYVIDEEHDSIYIGVDKDTSTIINNIHLNNGTGSIENNKYIIKYNNKVIKEFNLINLSSDRYDLTKGYIYLGFDETNNLTNDVFCENCSVTINNNTLEVKYNNIKVDEFPIIKLNTEYEVTNKKIFVFNDYDDSETILSKINCNIGNLSIDGNKLTVKYNDEIIDEYIIYNDKKYIESNDYSFNDETMIAYGINTGLLVSDLFNITNSTGTLHIIDSEGTTIPNNTILKTGYILRATFSDNITDKLDYILSIKGDVLGTGIIDNEGAKHISRHIVDKNVISGNEYLLSADYDGNGVIKMNDVTRMLIENRQNIN